ncbi:MAG: hypothetical protein N2255_02805, partial [Kiritimatiellae bacterium]|nr:hypothetical protein [Kiritimatiellia bacterium]
ARFMAGRWAAGAVHFVPVFGERGALLEHMVFDAFFNVPRIIGRFVAQHTATLLNLWLLAGLAICGFVFGIKRVPLFSKGGINLLLAVTALFILPRALFYPVLKGRQNRQNRSGP